MKKLICSLMLSLCSFGVFATDTWYSCVNDSTSNDTCKVALDVTVNNGVIVAEFAGGKLEWCNGWVETGCQTTGKFRVLNGEFTMTQLNDVGLKLYTRQGQTKNNMWVCSLN